MKSYIFNLETTKIELHFKKEEYALCSDEQKKKLKSAFLFSSKNKCWVSRAKEPNLYRAKEVARMLGFQTEERINQRISLSQQIENKSERAQERSERFEQYSQNAQLRAQSLQKPIMDKQGDIAFFTQPIIQGHSGSQAFAKQRERMFEKYRKGFEEYRKSEYFKEKSRIAKDNADNKKLKDRGYLDRKIKQYEKEIKQREKILIKFENELYKIENGENSKYTAEMISKEINSQLELISVAQDKEGFYSNCMDALGGILFSAKDISVGCKVLLPRWGIVEVIGKGPKNITYKILEGGASGLGGKAAYAEILEVVV